MRLIRLTFEKKGTAKYLSHLDMQRMMMRAVRRAGIDLWYTEGFNPHPYMTFAMPLSLGIESEGEPLDIKSEGTMSNAEILSALNINMPQGIKIIKAADAVMKTGEIAFAEYEIIVSGTYGDKFRACISSGSLPVEKSAKSGRKKVMKEINACEMISAFTAEDRDGITVINTVLACGSEKNLSPMVLIEALKRKLNEDFDTDRVLRKRLMNKDFKTFE